jgi:hypothetical protein
MRTPLTLSLALVALALAGCTDDPSDETALDDDQTMSGLPDEDLTAAQEEVDLAPMDEPADIAAKLHRITATPFNLNIFRHGCYHSGILLDWSCKGGDDGKDAHFAHKTEVGSNDIEVADNHGGFWGECVSLVKAATKSDVVTGDWRPGKNVFAGLPDHGLPSGTALATFPGGRYEGHTVIFLAYVRDNGKVVGMRVADQNWNGRTVKRHVIHRESGSSVANANNYFAVLVP